jgi:hypothetical protein
MSLSTFKFVIWLSTEWLYCSHIFTFDEVSFLILRSKPFLKKKVLLLNWQIIIKQAQPIVLQNFTVFSRRTAIVESEILCEVCKNTVFKKIPFYLLISSRTDH